MGTIDILHASRPPSLRMLARAIQRQDDRTQLTIYVLRTEDVIGYKVQAMANNPKRIGQEQRDIESLLDAHQGQVDWQLIQQYYDIFDLNDAGKQLRSRYEVQQ